MVIPGVSVIPSITVARGAVIPSGSGNRVRRRRTHMVMITIIRIPIPIPMSIIQTTSLIMIPIPILKLITPTVMTPILSAIRLRHIPRIIILRHQPSRHPTIPILKLHIPNKSRATSHSVIFPKSGLAPPHNDIEPNGSD